MSSNKDPLYKIDQLLDSMKDFENLLKVSQSQSVADSSDGSIKVISSMFSLFKDHVLSVINEIKGDLHTCNQRINDLEQYSRRNCVVVHGITEDAGSSEAECRSLVLDLFNHKMNIDIQSHHIDRTHRLGLRSSGKKNRAIIVKFCSYVQKRAVFSNKKILKGSKVYISESLTKLNYELYTQAKDDFGIENVWTIDGRVTVKDMNNVKYTIKSLDHLNDMKVKITSDNVANVTSKPTQSFSGSSTLEEPPSPVVPVVQKDQKSNIPVSRNKKHGSKNSGWKKKRLH